MTASTELVKQTLVNGLLQGWTPLQSDQPHWLNTLRSEAAECAGILDIPTTRDEEWRFTDLALLRKHSFQPATLPPRLGLPDIERFIVPEAQASRIVFVDGVYAPRLSSPSDSLSGAIVSSLREALSMHAVLVRAHLAQHANFQQDVFSALNTRFLDDGALIVVAKDQAVLIPIHLLFIATQQKTVNYPRCLVITEPGSKCTLIEDYVSLTDDTYFTDAVTEIAVGENAHVRHAKLQRESRAAFHIAQCSVALGRDSIYTSNTITLGARLSRYNLQALQKAEGVDCTLDGLAMISGRQLADTHTTMDHAMAYGKSAQLHKCIVDGAAHAVFNGKVQVRKDAQLTDSTQSSRNLLLSERARVDTKPQLEIFADDVKCTHGATVGQLDADELFYLKSRGLDDLMARNLLTYAFAAEIIDRIPIASLKQQLRKIVLKQTRLGKPNDER